MNQTVSCSDLPNGVWPFPYTGISSPILPLLLLHAIYSLIIITTTAYYLNKRDNVLISS